MSNYLTNLATRSVSQEQAMLHHPLQPRPLALFEPWPGVGMGAQPAPTLPPVATEENEAWETAVAAPPPTPSPAPPTVTATQIMVGQTAVPPATHTPPEPLPPTHRPERPPASITILRETVRPETPAPLPTAHPTPAHITTTIHAAAQQQPIQPAALPPTAPPLPVAAAHPQPATSNGRSPTPTRPSPITITPAQTIPTAPPSIHHSPFAIHHSQFLPQTPEPTPTIHVTIGRIEVRATPPPTAVREKRQSPTPTMSLDEYLRQRNGEQR